MIKEFSLKKECSSLWESASVKALLKTGRKYLFSDNNMAVNPAISLSLFAFKIKGMERCFWLTGE